jgi:hypothetical protein
MYLSLSGQPSLAGTGAYFREPGSLIDRGQDIFIARKIGEWTVTLARVYGQGDNIAIAYTITGPHIRYTSDEPILSTVNKTLRAGYRDIEDDTIGPVVGTITFSGVPETAQRREIALHFEVPAIHVRPGRYPCEVPGLPLAEYPTATRIPDNIEPGSIEATPVPDIQSVGPFVFDFQMNVDPRPTQVPVPSSIPTVEFIGSPIPLPQATGQP